MSFEGRVLSDRQLGLHYRLFAVSDHFGGLGGGHYVAVARNSVDGQWYQFDDSSVSEVDERVAADRRQSAYMLFYQRIEPGPDGPPAHVEAGPARDAHLEPRPPAPAASHAAPADITMGIAAGAEAGVAPFVGAGDDTKQ